MSGTEPQDGGLLAAVDLGSNSFHLAVVRLDHGQLRQVTALSEKVQLAAGLDDKQRLTDEAQARALACLSRFAQHLQGIEPRHLRIVGTNALRVARNARTFTAKAEKVLNHPVEIIAGREEARLIYVGVSHTLAGPGRRLVVDIGGGSTEFIIGEKYDALATESLHMGCVTYTLRFFPSGAISAKAFDKAVTCCRQEVLSIKAAYQALGWHDAVGSSGTVKAVRQVQQLMGLASPEGRITYDGLLELRKQVLRLQHTAEIDFPGLKDDRKAILPAGLAILLGVFEELGLKSMEYSDGALREGVLFDMLGRFRHEDVREHSVQSMLARYHVDRDHAGRVATTASRLLAQASAALVLDEDDAALLRWAALSHELGTTISHTGFHKHGAYILRHSDLPGFSRPNQERLALLVGAHRRKIKPEQYNEMSEAGGLTLPRLCALLRLAVVLHHSRSREPLPDIRLECGEMKFELRFPEGWLARHPLTREDLATEAESFAALGMRLVTSEY
ncbi:MAG: exopolyphosphatase [Moraxellaceae bacterium]|jgi:exopolyphosphatase/guanosine-5'-triphosphate,3'-diphosphate pyrophosphatase|nr:exopolyphosphatase [Moraxellaceae bacterium]